MEKKPSTKKATTVAKTPSAKSVPATTKAAAPKAAAPSSSKPSSSSAAAPDPKPPTTPKTPKPPAVPKAPAAAKPAPAAAEPVPPTTPKTPKAASKPAATSRPPTAKVATAATKPAPSATKPAPSASKPAPKSTGAAKAADPAKKLVKSASAKAASKAPEAPKSALPKSASAKVPAKAASHDAPAAHENKTPRDKPSTAAPARPATSTAAAAKPAAAPAAKRPATATATAAAKKVPPVDTAAAAAKAGALPKKSPRSPKHPESKSPRHNAATARTTSEIPVVPAEARIAAGTRTVSVGGNITRAAAPAGRRRATSANPLKNRQSTPTTTTTEQRPKAAANMLSGLGLLASVGATGDGHEMNGVQLRKVSDDKPKVLVIHVKGRRHVMARVTETHHRSLNKGDAFVIVDPSTRRIFEWRGATANKMEIAKAMDLAGRIKNKEFSGRAEIFVLEDGKNDHHQGFWELIGGKANVAAAEHGGEDEEVEKQDRADALYGVEEKAPGKLVVVEIAKQRFNKDMLISGQIYLLDCHTEVYLWQGKGCPTANRNLLQAKAQEILAASKKRPKWVVLTRVIEGAEPEIFKEKFTDWPSTLPITMAAIPKGNVAGSRTLLRFDVGKMFIPAKRDDRVIDEGTGKVEIWRVKDHTKEPIVPNMYGQFFDSESYVILYTYMQRNREMYIIYFWQGKRSSITEKGSSALLTIDLDDSIGGNAVQIRVVQNKEPKHFMKLFKGRIVIHHKADESEEGASIVPETALYQIRGFNTVEGGSCDVRAVPLPSTSTKYLNTNDIFLLNTTRKQYIWYGSASNRFFQVPEETLVELGASFKGSREQVLIREGEEPKDFWEGLGEKDFPDLDSVRVKYYTTEWTFFPRLFHCSSASGAFQVEEVVEWDQEDLDPGHLNILDTSGDIFLWTGQRANLEEEKKLAMETVLDYAKRHPARKEQGIVSDVLSITGRREPVSFRSVFHGWDESKTIEANGLNDSIKVEDMLKELSRTYTLAELRNPPKMLDSTKLESYLADEEFQEVFKMDRPTFLAQPLWKQEQQKKNVGLY